MVRKKMNVPQIGDGIIKITFESLKQKNYTRPLGGNLKVHLALNLKSILFSSHIPISKIVLIIRNSILLLVNVLTLK